MSALLESIQRGIDSATYNPKAEEAAKDRKEQTLTAQQKYSDMLDAIKKKIDDLVLKKRTTPTTLLSLKDLLTNAMSPLTVASSITESQWLKMTDGVKNESKQRFVINDILYFLSYVADTGPIVSQDSFTKKQIDQATVTKYNAYFADLQKWNKTITNLTLAQIQDKQITVKADIMSMFTDTNEANLLLDVNQSDAIASMQTKNNAVQQQKDAEFNPQRLAATAGSIALKVLGSLLYITFAFFVGMLCANEAMGRSNQYRVLYFIYGAIFAPIIVFYYLYKWFQGTSPKIYTMLPLTTYVATSSLGRYLLYPFSYIEDEGSTKLTTDFMKASADLAKTIYIEPTNVKAGLETVLPGLAKMGLASTSSSTIVKGLETVKLQSNILTGLEKLKV